MPVADAPPPVGRFTRIALIAAGWLCVALGVIALALPIIPTTPFLIAAAACFARSSPRFYQWLLGNRVFGPLIRNYREKGGFTRKQKIVSLLTLWPVVIVSAVFVPAPLWARAAMVAAAAAASAYVVLIKTIKG